MQSVTPENTFQVEMLSIEQFAAKMGVNRSTVYDWRKSGHLRAGRHFIKMGETILFAWGAELLQKLHEDSCERLPETVKAQDGKEPEVRGSQIPRVPSTQKKGMQVNLNY